MKKTIDIICNEAIEVALKTGKYLKDEQQKLSVTAVEEKSTRNYVTYIDKEAERITVEGLKRILPEASFLAEEETVEYEKKEYTWIVDPLDGTTNYVHGDSPYSVSIALTHNNEIILGIVYDPVLDELYCATSEGGSTLNGVPIKVSQHPTLQNGYIGFGIPYHLDERGEGILKRTTEQYRKSSFRIKGSAAVELCYVAAGRSDAYFHSGLSPWDVAAGSIILKKAGGTITDFSGNDNYIFGREIVGSNGLIHREIMDNIIKER